MSATSRKIHTSLVLQRMIIRNMMRMSRFSFLFMRFKIAQASSYSKIIGHIFISDRLFFNKIELPRTVR